MEPSFRHWCRLAICVAVAGTLSGCADVAVQPWEKGTLARPDMSFGQEPADARLREHIYTSREASSGGAAVGGGGCGCN